MLELDEAEKQLRRSMKAKGESCLIVGDNQAERVEGPLILLAYKYGIRNSGLAGPAGHLDNDHDNDDENGGGGSRDGSDADDFDDDALVFRPSTSTSTTV